MSPYVQYMYSYPHKTAYRPLEGVSLQQYIHLLQGSGHGLYVHLPFCQAKCGYCNLFSVTGQSESDIDQYLEAVERQSIQYEQLLGSVQTEFSELTIGGGTPLYLSERQLEQLLTVLKAHFQYAPEREFIIETAPNQTDEKKLQILKDAGVTRVSMGIQSFHDEELAALGRQHRADQARKALHLLKNAGFACVNVDFIYGIPGQTQESLLASLKEALDYEPDEIFLYPLYVKHGVGMEQQGIVPDDDAAYAQYECASAFLKRAGFCQDSMRRFVRRRPLEKRTFHECGFATSLALGCGGRSYLGRLHFCSPYAITRAECLERLSDYEHTVDFTEITHGILLSDEECRRRYVIRHLMILPGLSVEGYQKAFHCRAEDDFPILEEWIEKGYAAFSGDGRYLALTEIGLGLSDLLGPQLISSQVRAAMEEWEAERRNAYDVIPGQFEKL